MSERKVAIVDDEPEMIALLKIELEAEGHNVLTAAEGQKGLDLVRREIPDIVLLDIMMPGMDGYEVLEKLKKDEKTKKIPVFMLTAKGLPQERDKGLALGADDYIAKPFDAAQLLAKMDRLFKD